MAKIAVELQQAVQRRVESGAPGTARARVLASGPGWSVSDVVCTSGPDDRPFEERHTAVCIAIVAAGRFQYRSGGGHELMSPGSLLLGAFGQCFECAHAHGTGDRCLSFAYAPEYFERIAADAGVSRVRPRLGPLRLPPLRALAPLVAQGCAGLAGSIDVPWDAFGVELAARTMRLANGTPTGEGRGPRGAETRVSRTLRLIEHDPSAELTLTQLAHEAGLSPYHYLRAFEQITGVTPHQYVLRTRLRAAALRLITEGTKVLDIALDCGFGDVSNFNRAFRAEFGASPRAYRQRGTEFGRSGA